MNLANILYKKYYFIGNSLGKVDIRILVFLLSNVNKVFYI
jgi:hypothetical protein